MNVHIWEGPEESIACGCAVRDLTISKMTDDYAEGTITAVDYIEGGIVFSDPWEATVDEKGKWSVRRKNDETSFWKDQKTGKVHFTANSEVDESMEIFIAERIQVFLETKQKRIGPFKMDENDRTRALESGKLFKVDSSFIFAAQIPDDSVGCSGSRCSNCNNKVAYCQQRCLCCGFPFIGPFGFPQLPKWESLTLGMKKELASGIFMKSSRGRLGYTNVEFVPLTKDDLKVIEGLGERDTEYFTATHSISPREVRSTLFE